MQVKGQATMGAPVIRCVAVDGSGGVTLTWTYPVGNTWTSYEVDTSTNFISGYVPVLPTITTQTVTSTYVNPPTSAYSKPVYFYVLTSTTNGDTLSDTVSSIYLHVTPGTGIAYLQWNAIHFPNLLSTSSSTYQIYRLSRYSPTWYLIGSVNSTSQNVSYNDTLTFCDTVTLHYRVEISDTLSSGPCSSVSNISEAVNLQAIYPPPQAIIDTVSVDNSANYVDISWSKSPAKNVIGYVINEYNPISSFQPIYTVMGINNTSIQLNYAKVGNPDSASLQFEVQYIDSCGRVGALSSTQATLFLKQKPDRCEQTNTLNWTAYENLSGNIGGAGIGGYYVYYSTNGGATYQLLATTGRGTTTYIDSNLNTTQTRCYYVQVFDAAHHDTTASSNIVCYNVSTALKPQYDYLRDASVVNNFSEVAVNAYIDTSSNVLGVYAGAGFYVLQRSIDSAGGYKSIDSVAANHHNKNVSFLDNTANPNQHSYHYQIITQDSCYHPIDTTNLGQTMLLTAVGQPNETNILTWNSYSDWYSGVYLYTIYRSEDGINFMNIDNYSPTINAVNTYTDNVKSITTGQGTFYYYIMAVEHASPFPFIDTSYSNLAQAYQDPIVYIPDAFNPKGVNRVFIPVGVFIDVTGYDFVILNRWGIVIFESKDPTVGWNGNGTNGKEEEEGVYVYLLTYTSSKGEYFQRKGTVTLLK